MTGFKAFSGHIRHSTFDIRLLIVAELAERTAEVEQRYSDVDMRGAVRPLFQRSKRLRRVEGQKHRLFSASLFVTEGFFLENGDVAEIQM